MPQTPEPISAVKRAKMLGAVLADIIVIMKFISDKMSIEA